jgi:outer membrane protein assembly factor BamB
MSVERFITELEQRELLTERQLARLRDAAIERQMSPKALAKFLVQKEHLTQKQATDVLHSVLLAGGDLDVASPPALQTSGFEPDPPELSLAPVDEVDEPDENAGDDAGGSSIFASYLTDPKPKPTSSSPVKEDELILLPDIDEQPPADVKANRLDPEPVKDKRRPKQNTPDDDVAEVSLAEVEAAPESAEPLDAVERIKPRMTTKLGRSKKRRKEGRKSKPSAKSAKSKGKWDSPLMLMGGGGLMLLLFVGGLIWWLMTRESGDQMLAQARKFRDSGAYAESITQYEDYLVSAPRHPGHNLAEVELALLRIRQPTEAGDFEQAFNIAGTQLKDVEDLEEFNQMQGEVAALLPQIAKGLADQSQKADPGSPDVAKFTNLANKALELCNNTLYLPKSLRDEGKLTAVRETLQLVERRSATKQALDDAQKTMQEALAAGDANKAYATFAQLLRTHNELTGEESLAATLQKITVAEQAAIKFVNEEQAAETGERPTPWVASLAVANRRVKPDPSRSAPTTGSSAAACFQLDGAAYALDAASGKLLWRRQVGHAHPIWPQAVEGDVLISDSAHNELLRVTSQTGQLKWRQAIGQPFAQPLVVGDRAFVAADSGRLFIIDLNSGVRLGYVQFAQPLRTAPTVDRTNEHLYLAGDHSCVYTILLKDLSCVGVYYLGHAEGSVAQPPAAVMDKVAVLENDGVETSRLRLLTLGENGAVSGQAADRRLTGLPSAAPYVAGRRVVVITDRGQIDAYDIGTGEGQEPLTLVATRAAPGKQPIVRYAALSEKNIWIGDTQLTKYSILPTGNRLPVEAIENNFSGSTFDHPLALFGDTVLHARRAKGRAGVVVAATATAQGNTLWETDLAIPPAGAPVVNEANKTLAVANSEGHLFRFDEAAIRSRIQDEPLAAQAMSAKLPALTHSVNLGEGRAVFCGPGVDQLLLYNPSLAASPAKWIQLDGPLACSVTPFADGIIVPLKIGQIFYLGAADGAKLALPFQATLEPQKEWHFTPAGAIESDPPSFVIADGHGKLYHIALGNNPQPHLHDGQQADAGPHPIESPFIAFGDSAFAIGGSSHLLRVKLPSLEPTGDANLPAPVVWGPFRVGDVMLLATADNQLMAVAADGQIKWKAAVEHGDLIGAPLSQTDSIVVSYKKGVIERRSLVDGKPAAAKNIEQPLAAGPVAFLQKLVLAAIDGTILVVDQP